MSEEMQKRLGADVNKMRNQVMSFTNDGAEFQLNVPDTNEVKEQLTQLSTCHPPRYIKNLQRPISADFQFTNFLSTSLQPIYLFITSNILSLSVTVSVQQQKQITMLQTSMQDMAEDHVRSQEAIIAWSTECIKGLQAQNQRLEKLVSGQRTEINNLAYNLQGYENESFSAPDVPAFDLEAPGLYKTKTPKVVKDCAELGDEEGGGNGLFFHTATGAEVEMSHIEFNPESRKGGPIKLVVPLEEVAEPQSKKTQAQIDQARYKYQSTKGFNLPSQAKKRWHWAMKKVVRNNRLKRLMVGLNRGKLPPKETIASKLALMDHKLYTIPVELRAHVKEREEVINTRIDTEVHTLTAHMAEQKHEYTAMGIDLQTNIDTTNERVDDVDKRLTKLQEQVDNGNKQLDEIELKLGKVIARVNQEETVLFDSIKARIQEANEKIVSVKASSGTIAGMMEKLNEMNEAMVEGIEYESDSERMDAEAKKLFEMLRFETELRNTRTEITLLDNNAFSLHEMLRFVRREILALSVLAGGDYEAIIPKESVNEMLALVDSGLTTIDSVWESITSANSLWRVHDVVLSHRWGVLEGVVAAVKNVSNIADDIVQIRETIMVLPTEDKVKAIGQEIVTTALVPVSENIEGVDKKAVKANDDTNTRVEEVDQAWKAGIDKLDRDMRDTFDVIQAQRSENLASGGGEGDDGAKPLSRGPIDLEKQLEPMIKDIVEMYVGEVPPSRSKIDGVVTSSSVRDFFSVEAVPDGQDGTVESSMLFDAHELVLVFNSSTAAGGDEEDMNDEIDEHQQNSASQQDNESEAVPGEGLAVGCLVKVVSDSKHRGFSGIVTALVEDDEEAAAGGEEGEGGAGDPSEEEKAEEGSGSKPSSPKRMRWRVAMTPKTPAQEGSVSMDGFETFETYENGTNPDDGSRAGTGGGNMDDVRRQMAVLSKKVEEIMREITSGGGGGGDGDMMLESVDIDAHDSRAGSPTSGPGRQNSFGNNSPSFAGGGRTMSPSFGASSQSQSHANMGGTSQSMMDTGSVMELISDSMKAVSVEIGDLRQTNAREMQRAKDAMRKAILHAINKAIQEEAEKDKPSMLTTKSLCVGCGRPSLVRGVPHEQDLISRGFTPSLNASVQPGGDIFRAGFRMPVNKNNSVTRLNGGMVPGGAKVYGEDSLFEGHGVGEEESHATLNTYSEILANIDHKNKGQVRQMTDAGPAGMSISITSTTAPIRQLSYPARNIRHAQGMEDAAMLRPIHRKGFPGKTSEKARAGANKTWVPERFDGTDGLTLSPKAVSIPRPKHVSQRAAAGAPGSVSMEARLDLPTESSIASSFHP
jgi:hypothetical protein